MTESMLERITRLYGEYVDTFRQADGKLPAMMELKRLHTEKVVENATMIADGERFSAEEREAALAAALLHDTGRYEQLKRYDTFRDSDSVDHAVFSHDIVKEKGWLTESQSATAILNAVLYHNRKSLPEGMGALTEVAAHTVRDADKLDIFRVLEDQLTEENLTKGSSAFWNLKITEGPNPEVVRAIVERRPVDYQSIKSLVDFVLIQVGWMISGLHFGTTRKLCCERHHLEYRQKLLHRLCNDPSIDELCDMANQECRR